MNKIVIVGWGARLTVLLLAFVNTRLLIDCVGTEGYAAYSIIISLTPWLVLMNLGIPITIQNSISYSRGQNRDYTEMRDQSFGAVLVVALTLSPVSMLMGWLTHRYLLINYPFTTSGAVAVAFWLIFIMGISQLFMQVMYAEHDALWPNLYPVFAPAWTAAILLIFKYFEFSDFNLLLLFVGLSNILMPIHAAWRLKLIDRCRFSYSSLKNIIFSSKDQLVFSILASVTLSIDYIIMSRILDAQSIVAYNLASRLYLTLVTVHTVLIVTNWTPVADLIHASQKNEARRLVEKIILQGLIIGGVGGFIIFFGMDFFVEILAGGRVDYIPLQLSFAFWLYAIIRICTDTYAMAVQGAGFVSKINKFIPIQALTSAFFQVLLGMQYGATGIVCGLVLSFILTAGWIIPRKFYKIVK